MTLPTVAMAGGTRHTQVITEVDILPPIFHHIEHESIKIRLDIYNCWREKASS